MSKLSIKDGSTDGLPSMVRTKTAARQITDINIEVTPRRLQEAVIWSEILGKPKAKSRKRRSYEN